ncbi:MULTISPECIES: hypothetical protein [unclassified Bacillus (in: firmicutes)]|uniref:hypothetical protein n=1 Tax=unclassified Bacillus (in: firmicutes) TaxID=185979 RepID=UPI00155F4505|nr:hypothetical protein [Bacillus sp. TH007]
MTKSTMINRTTGKKSRIRQITRIKYKMIQVTAPKIGERIFELMIVVLLIVSFSYLATSENVSLSTDIPDSSLLIAITLSFLQKFFTIMMSIQQVHFLLALVFDSRLYHNTILSQQRTDIHFHDERGIKE